MDNNWYKTESWYAPLYSQEPNENEKLKKNRSPWRIMTGILSFMLIAAIVVTSVIFRSNGNIIVPIPDMNSKTENDHRADNFDDEHESTDDSEDTFQDFFNSFYTTVTTDIAEVNIERAEVPINFSITIKDSEEDELSFAELYEKCSKSVVSITGHVNGKNGYSWGTGFIVAKDGIVVTNTHVIDECDSATVTLFDGSEYEAKLVGADSISDIAVLKIDAKGLVPAVIGDSTNLCVGQQVAAIGNPLGESFKYTLTDGIISAIDRDIDYNGRTMTLLQTNTALNEGNSGGPLYNMYGQVIGVTNMKMMSSYSSIEGIGFAIPSSTFSAIVNSILQNGEVRGRTAIGITVGAIPTEAAEKYNIPEGLYITEVTEGSDAAKKGILAEDILIAVNGIPITTTEEVAAIKNECIVGDTLTLTVYRNGETMDFTIVLMDTNDIYR